MNIVEKHITDIRPYEKNPRKNDDAVKYVAASIKQFGWKVPIVIDKDGVIVAGHTRYKAALELNIKEVPCVIADDLTPEQIKAYRLADNKVAEKAFWDFDLLDEELDGIFDLDMSEFGFSTDENDYDISESGQKDDKYTSKTNVPQYDVKGDVVHISELCDTSKADDLLREIDMASITDEEKDFLRKAACRHFVFNYKKIAEYYATASDEMQELMERSALVIIDYANAMANGYVKLSNKLKELMGDA